MQGDFEKAEAWRRQIQLPSTIDRMLTFEQIEIHNPQRTEKPKKARGRDWTQYKSLGQTEQFMESFASMPLQQKFEEYCRVIGLIQRILRGQALMAPELQGQRYRFDAYIKDGIIRKSWQKCSIELNMANSVAYTVGREASSVDLHFYLMRRSKNKHRFAFALESIRLVMPRIVRIGFDKFEEVSMCFDVFRHATDKAHGQNYYKEFKPYIEQKQQQQQSQIPPVPEQQPQPQRQQQVSANISSPRQQQMPAPKAPIRPQPYVQESQSKPQPEPYNSTQPLLQPSVSTHQLNYSPPQRPSVPEKPIYNNAPENPPAPIIHHLHEQPTIIANISGTPSITRPRHGSDEPFFSNLSHIRQTASITNQPSISLFRQSTYLTNSIVGNNPTSKGSLIRESFMGSKQEDATMVGLKRQCAEVFQKMLESIRFQDIASSTNYIEVNTAPTYRILQHEQRKNKFKLILNISAPRDVIMAGIVDPANYPLWNPQVQAGHTKLRLFDSNTTVCYQRHKSAALEKAREFIYARHLFKKEGKIFMVDRSIQNDLFPKSWEFIRGTINSCIWSAQELLNGRMSQLIVQLDISENGTMPSSVELEAHTKYLEGLAKLDYYLLKHKKFQTKVTDYFDLQWSFDKKQQQFNVLVSNPEVISPHKPARLSSFAPPQHDNSVTRSKMKSQPLTVLPQIQSVPSSDSFLPVGDQLFNQQLSLINEDDFVTAVGKQDYQQLQSRSIAHLSFQSMNSDEQPAQAIVVSPKQKYQTPSRNDTPTPPKLHRKFTDELGNELEDELRIHGNRNTDNRQFSKQLQHLLAGRESISNSALKAKSHEEKKYMSADPRQNYNGDDESEPNLKSDKHETNGVSRRVSQATENQSIYKFNPYTGYIIPSNNFLKCKSTIWPIHSGYREMSGGRGWKNFLLGNRWKVNSRGELICTDEEKTRELQSVYKYLVRTLGDRTISPKLPVGVLSSMSVLEHIARGLCFMPYYMEQAAKQSDDLTRFKLVVAECLATSLLQIDLETPFNPLAGETFQGWVYGCPVYCEQVSARQNMVAVFMIGRGYRVRALLETRTELAQTGKISFRSGEYKVEFDSYIMGPISFKTADCLTRGIVSDEVKWSLVNRAYIYDEKNSLYSEIAFNSHQQADSLRGGIYRVPQSFLQYFAQNHRKPPPTQYELICDIQGNWSERMLIGREEYFSINRDKPCVLDYESHPVVSDSIYREDIIYKRRGDLARAQIQKQRLQEEDKHSRRLRSRSQGQNHF